jgi:hypothetical protein
MQGEYAFYQTEAILASKTLIFADIEVQIWETYDSPKTHFTRVCMYVHLF